MYSNFKEQENLLFIAATDFTVTLERSKVITFARPIIEVYLSLFIKNPSSESLNLWAFIDPLHHSAWFMIGLFCIGLSLGLFLLTRYVHHSLSQPNFQNLLILYTIYQMSDFRCAY